MTDVAPVRIFGLDLEPILDFRTEHTRNAGLYRALDAAPETEVVDVHSPTVPKLQTQLIRLVYIRHQRDRWRQRSGLSTVNFRARTGIAERVLLARDGTYDVVLQVGCVFAPGNLARKRPYVLYLDSTLILNHRHWRPAIPHGARARGAWMQLEHQVYAQAHHIFTMSDWARESVLDDYAIEPERVSTVGAGTNLVPADSRERSYSPPVALFVGMEFGRKGGPQLLAAWRTVAAQVPGAELWIVGTRKQPRDQNGIRWFGRIPADELRNLYAKASVFVLPSLYDLFPHVFREALGNGLPCVATNTGAVTEIVRDGVDSIVVSPGNVGALAQALIDLLRDPERAREMGSAGRDRVLVEASWEAVVGRIVPHLPERAS